MGSSYILVNKADNVVVTLKNYEKGETLTVQDHNITLKEEILVGHKIAIKKIKKGENVIKYGFPIGHAKETIEVDLDVHKHRNKDTKKLIFHIHHPDQVYQVYPLLNLSQRSFFYCK